MIPRNLSRYWCADGWVYVLQPKGANTGAHKSLVVPAAGASLQYHGQHALRERARKIDQGILIIRFEVPFHIWCSKCGEKIAKGELPTVLVCVLAHNSMPADLCFKSTGQWVNLYQCLFDSSECSFCLG